MAYLGNDLQVAFPSYRNIDDISGSFNGVTTSFSLTVDGVAPIPAPINSQQCLISVNGVVQRPDDSGTEGFRLSGGNIIFASAPAGGVDFFGVILAGADYVNVGANFPSGSAAAPSITFDSDLDTGIYNPAGNQIGFSTAGTQRLVINSSGQISSGLGTAAAPAFSFISDPNTGLYSPGADQVAISTNGAGRLFVDASGNIGVNQSSPSYPLDISGPSARINIAPSTTTNGANVRMTNSGGTVIVGLDSGTSPLKEAYGLNVYHGGAYPIVFSTNAQERLRITSAGLVGIGTTSPSNSLNVVGIADFDGGAVSTTSRLRIQPDEGTKTVFLDSRTAVGNSELAIKTGPVAGSTERCRIDGSGRLLVGTSTSYNSTSLLQVVGPLATGGQITLANSFATQTSNVIFGQLNFISNAGSSADVVAEIYANNDGTHNAGDKPTKLVFSVTADGSASPSEAMRINNAGELLVGYTSDNGAYKLQVNSQIFATSAIIATSDGRYKENVAALDSCVDLVKALRPVSFDWKVQEPVTRVDEDGETVVVREAHNFPDGKQVGFIAQEVEEVLADKPWLGSVIKQNVRPAVTDADGNELAPEEKFLGIAEGNLVAVLTSALKDAIGEIESLKARVAALESV